MSVTGNNMSLPSAESPITFDRSSYVNCLEGENLAELPNVHQFDTDGKLTIYCYENLSPEDSDKVRMSRGVITEAPASCDDTKAKLVSVAFAYTPEYTLENDRQLLVEKLKNMADFKCYVAEEGALIRLVFFDNKWYCTTHRKLDAHRSKWGSRKSFGDMFDEAIIELYVSSPEFAKIVGQVETMADVVNKWQATLDVTKQYAFLIRNSHENRLVCAAPAKPTVFHVGTFSDCGRQLTLGLDIGIPRPTQVHPVTSSELFELVEQLNYNKCQGVICFESNGRPFKIYNPRYAFYYGIRANEASVNFRYLQIRQEADSEDKMAALAELYPHMVPSFEEYERILTHVITGLHKKYIIRHINRSFIKLPPEEHTVLKACHQWYLDQKSANVHDPNRQPIRVTQDVVREVLNKQSPVVLNKLIRAVKFPRPQQIQPDADLIFPCEDQQV